MSFFYDAFASTEVENVNCQSTLLSARGAECDRFQGPAFECGLHATQCGGRLAQAILKLSIAFSMAEPVGRGVRGLQCIQHLIAAPGRLCAGVVGVGTVTVVPDRAQKNPNIRWCLW